MSAVVVTGLGAITPLGRDVESSWAALLEGRTATRRWEDLADFRVDLACRVEGLEVDPRGRGLALAEIAAAEALAQAGLAGGDDVAVLVGTTLGESRQLEDAAEGAPLALERALASAWPRALGARHGLGGPALVFGAACAAGNYAIGHAAALVGAGRARAALAGGVEPFSRTAQVGFSRSRAMAPDRCRPFDARRAGMQLGEAAAFLVLERAEDAERRGARPLALVRSLGLSCDADHPTAPRADGAGMAAAMRRALARAGLGPEEVDAICAHGSGTPASDAAEARAIAAVFPGRPPVFGLKGALGHSLGAATAVEAVASALALRDGLLPPTAGHEQPDPAMALDVVARARPRPGLRRVLSGGYAFGGLNSALILEGAP